ncbi:MAG: ATP-binding protein [Desulfobacterales bacterium]
MIFPAAPIIMVDVIGSISMILLALLCLWQVRILKKRDPNNVIWTFLLWVCFALACFAVSRSAGHLLKQVMLLSDRRHIWEMLRPLSGSINTLMLMAVGSVILYFERSWKIYEQIVNDKWALQSAHKELVFLNQNLEKLVAERTKALTSSVYNYRRIFEVSRDMILVSRIDGTIVDINPAGMELLGIVKSEDVFEKKIQSFFNSPMDWNRLKAKIEQEGFSASDEIKLKCRNGSARRVLISSGLDRAVNEREDTIHFLIKDIEQRKMIEQQMAQADKLASIGHFSAGIAHEINNPLGIILGYTQLLLRGEDPESEKYRDLKTIEKHVRTCKSIVEDLLNFARGSQPSQERLQLNEVIEDIVSFIRQHSKLEKVKIVKDYDHGLPPMVLDGKKIKQVVMNLIINARYAVGENGVITLSTRYRPNSHQAVIEVTDTGCGIEEKSLSNIFDPFFTTKPTGEGTGLGLSVSYGIIKNHGGDISVESDPGKGSTFTVILPITS